MARRILLCLFFWLLTGNLSGQTPACDTQGVLKRFLATRYPHERNLRVAAYDHLKGRWSAWRWDGTHLTPLTGRNFEVPHTNEPTLIVPRGAGVLVAAVNTVPVLYSTKLTASTEADIEGLAALQEIASLFGNFVTTGITQIATVQPQTARSSVADSAVMSSEFRTFDASSVAGRSARAAFVNRAESDTKQMGRDLDMVLARIASEGKQLSEQNLRLKETAGAAADQISELAAKRDEASLYLQLAESGSAQSFELKDVKTVDDDLVTAFANVRKELDAAEKLPTTCPATLEMLDKALVWQLDGIPEEAAAIQRFRTEWTAIEKALTDDRLRSCPADLIQQLSRIGRWMKQYPPGEDGVSGPLREAFLNARQALFEYLNIVSQRGTLTSKSTEMLGKRATAVKHATQLASLADLQSEIVPDRICGLRAGVLEVERIEGTQLHLSPTKVRTEEFSITVIPTFASDLERRRADVTGRKYNLTRGSWDFDVDTAVVYTDIQDPEYQVSEREEDTDDDGDKEKVFRITEKARDTRAGGLALLLTAKPERARGFGLQIGFGMDTGNPSIFGGLGFGLGDYVKISGGRTWQRVTKLGRDQDGKPYVFGQTVASATDISTREGFDNDWYVALSITIDNLPFFKQPEE